MENSYLCVSGVSEVFGVMLLLTVTIIVACVVSVFAGGFSFDSSTDSISANIAASEFHIADDDDLYTYVVFDHLSGDPLNLNSTSVTLGIRSSAKETIIIDVSDIPSDTSLGKYLENYGDDGSKVAVGDRFVLYADGVDNSGVFWEDANSGKKFYAPFRDFLTYQIIDKESQRPVCSGMIPVPDRD